MYNYKDKKILIMGLGLHGGGLAVANWFIKQGAKVRITDLKSKQELASSLKKLQKPKRWQHALKLTLGRHDPKDFEWADLVVQNPGVPRESPYLKIARRRGAKIENEATLFFKLAGAKNILGITGTRGKSTVTNLVWQLLKQKYPNAQIAGNIATSPMFQIINNVKSKKPRVVLELSSWHLENLGEQRISPHLAVITNILPDHLNRYRSLADYAAAKANIFKFQTQNDFAILNFDNKLTKKLGLQAPSRRYWFSKKYFSEQNGSFVKTGLIFFRQNGTEQRVLKVSDIKLPGIHNLENVLAAVTVAMIEQVPATKVALVIKTAKGLPHRLELVREVNGVKYINDTAATTPDATIAALRTLSIVKKSEIILIAGGADKKIPQQKFNELASEIKKTSKAVILFKGQGSDKIEKALKLLHACPPQSRWLSGRRRVTCCMLPDTKTMSEAVKRASAIAKPGDIILLSPACASFGLFVNEFDRGEQFKKIIKKM